MGRTQALQAMVIRGFVAKILQIQKGGGEPTVKEKSVETSEHTGLAGWTLVNKPDHSPPVHIHLKKLSLGVFTYGFLKARSAKTTPVLQFMLTTSCRSVLNDGSRPNSLDPFSPCFFLPN